MTGLYAALAILVLLGIAYVFVLRQGRKNAEADIRDAEDEIRNEARDARQRLTAADRERLRKRYGQRGPV